jgi:NAD+--asparagine ADP-ribosyltransferase
MLVSRGPVYMDADTAGAKLTSTETRNAFDAGVVIPMDEWHTGCDCTVAPVFDENNWPGKQAADDALEQWEEAAKGFTYDPNKKYRIKDRKTGKIVSTTLPPGAARYRETLNNLRFTLEGRDPAERRVVRDQPLDTVAAIRKELARQSR